MMPTYGQEPPPQQAGGSKAVMKTVTKGMHMIQTENPADIQEFVDEGTLHPGTAMFSRAGMLIMSGDHEQLRAALESGQIHPNESANSMGHLPLIGIAAKYGQRECIELLLKHGVDMEARMVKANGEPEAVGTAMMVAVENGFEECAEMMIAAGADTDARDPALNTAAHLAVGMCSVRVLRALQAKNPRCLAEPNMNGRTPLHVAVHYDWTRHSQDSIGGRNPALEEAPRDPDDVVRFLVEDAKVPLSPENHAGETPLHNAVMEGNKTAAHILLEHNAQCAERCTKCKLQAKIVARALAKSGAKREEKARIAAFQASITQEDIDRADALLQQLLSTEEKLLKQQREQEEQIEKTKAQKKAARKTKLALEQIRSNHAALSQVTGTDAYKEAAVKAAKKKKKKKGINTAKNIESLKARFDEEAADSFVASLGGGGGGEGGGDAGAGGGHDDGEEEGGLSQAEIDEWLRSVNRAFSVKQKAAEEELASGGGGGGAVKEQAPETPEEQAEREAREARKRQKNREKKMKQKARKAVRDTLSPSCPPKRFPLANVQTHAAACAGGAGGQGG
jgi:ankyrin repeat protein